MLDQTPRYASFLLRIWRRGAESPAGWLVSLEDTGTGERYLFAGLPEAWSFLAGQDSEHLPPLPPPGAPEAS
jgi:hypothetical protein